LRRYGEGRPALFNIMNRNSTPEGVETEVQVGVLAASGCREI
jgi:hypothetical protein